LAELQKNARISNKELATRVGLAPSSCLERVRRLEETGILKGYHAETEQSALGIQLGAMIQIRLRQHTHDNVEGFRDYLLSLPEVLSLCYLAGPPDFVIQVGVRDTNHLRELILDSITARNEVEHVDTAIIFEHAQRWVIPNYTHNYDEAE